MKFFKYIFQHVSLYTAILAFIYSISYFYASLSEDFFNIKSENIKYCLNIAFAFLAFIMMLLSRKKKLDEMKEKEINFSLAFCALLISIIDPFAKYVTSKAGYQLIEKHLLGLTALLSSIIFIILLLMVMAVGIKCSTPKTSK